MLRVESSGSFSKTQSFLDKMIRGDLYGRVEALATQGVAALQAATPQESGETAASWSYEIENEGGSYVIHFLNSHEVDGFNVAVGIQYGHGTGNGGYVSGYDYINPALKPIFDSIAEAVWKEVVNA
jgi:hypothetical protein